MSVPGRDQFWAARLVESTRFHLAVIMQDEYSEEFYVNMCRIAKYKIYLGYKTLKGKDCQLTGIKDFLWSRHYGLGVSNMNEFMRMITKQSINDKTKEQFARHFLDWLCTQDRTFNLPPEIFEYRRLLYWIRKKPDNDLFSKKRNPQEYVWLKFIYHTHPDLLVDIGPGRKYKALRDVMVAHGYTYDRQSKSVSIQKYPSQKEIKQTAKSIYGILGPQFSKKLVLEIIRYHKDQHPEELSGPPGKSV